MNYVSSDFRKLDNREIVPIVYQHVNCHMIFDVKTEEIRRKARLVVGENMTEPPDTTTYEIAMSREKVMIVLTLSALNNFPVKIADIQNSYIAAPVVEKICLVLGCEFGEYSGKKEIVVRALYGLNSDRSAFRNHLSDCMKHLGFIPFPNDLGLWMIPMVRPKDGLNYYVYVLIYVNDVMVIHHDAKNFLRRIDK